MNAAQGLIQQITRRATRRGKITKLLPNGKILIQWADGSVETHNAIGGRENDTVVQRESGEVVLSRVAGVLRYQV